MRFILYVFIEKITIRI